jgi:hypothetical protein
MKSERNLKHSGTIALNVKGICYRYRTFTLFGFAIKTKFTFSYCSGLFRNFGISSIFIIHLVFYRRILVCSVGDPDPQVFGPSGSGSGCFWAFRIRIHQPGVRIQIRILPFSEICLQNRILTQNFSKKKIIFKTEDNVPVGTVSYRYKKKKW